MIAQGWLRRSGPSALLAWLGPLCGVLAALVVVVVGVDAVYDDRRLRGLTWLTQPGAWWTVTLLFALVAVALLARRVRTGSRGVIGGFAVAGTTTFLTLVLGGATYLGCTGPGVAFWTPLASTLKLFTGNVTSQFGATGCAPSAPLALQVAQLLGLVSVFAAVGGVLAAVLTDQVDRTVIRWSRRVVLVTGVDADSAEVLSAAAASRPPGVALVAIIEQRDPRLVSQARSWGARVVIGDPTAAEVLAPVVVRRRWGADSSRLRTAYLMDSDPGRNDRVGEVLQEQASGLASEAGVGRIVARIDSPLMAEDWRRRALEEDAALLSDTTGTYQVTARAVVDRVLALGGTHLVLLGESMLTLAMLDEVAQLDRERSSSAGPPLRVVLGVDTSSELLADHVRHQARFGSVDPAGEVTTFARGSAVSAVAELVAGGATVVVVNAATPAADEQVVSERLAALLPGVPVLTWAAGARGLPSRSMMGNLWGFGLTLVRGHVGPDGEPVGELPEDGWTRAARRLHETYVARLSGGTGTGRSWAELSDFYRESNVRQVWQAMTSATLAGRTWVRPGDGRAPLPLSPAEIESLAPLEHASWLTYYRDHGVRPGPRLEGDGRPARHPSLVPWAELPAEQQERTTAGLADSYVQLAALGYVPFPAVTTSADAIAASRWRFAERSGSVTAARRTAPWNWVTASGQVMNAVAGDWEVTGPDGDRWSVTDADLHATYTQVAGDQWQRAGTVLARPGVVGEVVLSQEGRAVVGDGEWVIRDPRGHEWVVPDAVFTTSYDA